MGFKGFEGGMGVEDMFVNDEIVRAAKLLETKDMSEKRPHRHIIYYRYFRVLGHIFWLIR